MYNCSLCGKSDSKTIREAREGKIVTICESCEKKPIKMFQYTIYQSATIDRKATIESPEKLTKEEVEDKAVDEDCWYEDEAEPLHWKTTKVEKRTLR